MGEVEEDNKNNGELISYGILENTEIFRYHHNGLKSGILFKYEGGILTARHVVTAHSIPGFKSHPGSGVDIGFKEDTACHGLPLGFSRDITIENVHMVTSSPRDPDKLIVIPGKIGFELMAVSQMPFIPCDYQSAAPYFRHGASGSPLIAGGHIIGVVTNMNNRNPYEVFAFVFLGGRIKKEMAEFGLSLNEI